jgi:hypothetical protein
MVLPVEHPGLPKSEEAVAKPIKGGKLISSSVASMCINSIFKKN